VDVTEVTPGDSFDVGAITVRVAATDHRPVEPTVAYRLEALKNVTSGPRRSSTSMACT
jgi:hypothetical protein